MESRDIIERFCDQCGWAWTIHNQYKLLYARSEERRRLLDAVARDYFGFMQEVLIDYMFLQFSRLTDPAKTGRFANLTAPYIADELDWPPDVRGVLRSQLKILLAFREKVLAPRNKLIAHADLKTHLEQSTLGGFPEGEDERFFRSLQEFVNAAHESAIGGPYPLNAVSPNDGESLVMSLRRGEAFEGLWDANPQLADQLLQNSEHANA